MADDLGDRVFHGPRGERDVRLDTNHPDFLEAQAVLSRAFELGHGDEDEIARAKALLAGVREARPARPDVEWVETHILPILDTNPRELASRFCISPRQITRWRKLKGCEGPCGRALPIIAFARGLRVAANGRPSHPHHRMRICKECLRPLALLVDDVRSSKKGDARAEAVARLEVAVADLIAIGRAKRVQESGGA